jgi:hypothetical protein
MSMVQVNSGTCALKIAVRLAYGPECTCSIVTVLPERVQSPVLAEHPFRGSGNWVLSLLQHGVGALNEKED